MVSAKADLVDCFFFGKPSDEIKRKRSKNGRGYKVRFCVCVCVHAPPI